MALRVVQMRLAGLRGSEYRAAARAGTWNVGVVLNATAAAVACFALLAPEVATQEENGTLEKEVKDATDRPSSDREFIGGSAFGDQDSGLEQGWQAPTSTHEHVRANARGTRTNTRHGSLTLVRKRVDAGVYINTAPLSRSPSQRCLRSGLSASLTTYQPPTDTSAHPSPVLITLICALLRIGRIRRRCDEDSRTACVTSCVTEEPADRKDGSTNRICHAGAGLLVRFHPRG